MFFGAVVKPGRNYPLVPHAEGFALHLSQASLAADVKNGTRASVLVKLGHEDDAVVLCTLCAGTQDTVLLDQFMTEYAELSIQGSVPVHITGYYSPEYGPDGEDGEEEEDEEYGLVSSTAILLLPSTFNQSVRRVTWCVWSMHLAS
jgi:FK506-binding nuclear protein